MKNQRDTIRKLINALNNEDADGGFWLPNIQRPFVWREDQIERLFDSIMRQYPISTLLVWRTLSGIKRRKFIDNYKASLRLTDYYVPVSQKRKRLVLDGQQRLQSLYIGLKGSYDGRELYFDVLSGDLVAPEDIRYRFRFQDAAHAVWPWVKFKDIVFNGSTTIKQANDLILQAGVDLEDAQVTRLQENLERARMEFVQDENVAYQELDSIDEPDAYTENDVVEIFIRANSGGTRLGKSDLLFSLLSSSWEDADLRMEGLLEGLNKSGYAFDRDFVLKCFLTLLDTGASYEVAKFRDGKTKDQITEQWEPITDAIRDVKDFLFGKTYIRHDKALPSYLVLIPLIYFRYHYPKQWKSAKGVDEYLLRSLLAGAFGGSPDTLIDKCVRSINETKTFDLGNIFHTIEEDGRNLMLSKDALLGLRYGMKELHLLFNLWYRQFDYQPAYQNNEPQVDHIFPQSMLRKVKVENPETGRKMTRYYQDSRDQVANCMLLTAKENGAGGKCDSAPDVWFREQVSLQGEQYLEMHLIPTNKALWKLERFDDFVKARRRLIVQKFAHMVRQGGSQ